MTQRRQAVSWAQDPASVTHPDFQRCLERIRRYLGADPAAVVAAGIRRGWCAYPDGQQPSYLTPGSASAAADRAGNDQGDPCPSHHPG